MGEIGNALHWGFIILGAATILLSFYWVGIKARIRQDKKSKKKRSIYASPRK